MVLLFTGNSAAFEIEIRPEVRVSSSEIKLAEIAEINAAQLSAAELEELKKLSFASSPAPGYSKRITRVLVDLSIRNLGYKKNDFQLEMPKTITVERKASVIKAEKISKLVEDYLQDNLDYSAEQIVLEKRNSKEIEIPAGDYQLKIADDQRLSLPNTNLKLEVWQDGKRIRSIFYPVRIALKLKVVVADKNLRNNSKINKSDFKVKEEKISGNPENLITEISEINFNNAELARNLDKGDILKTGHLKIPYAVKWGQKLHLDVEVNNIKISTFVEAKERAKVGEVITVENLDSGYEFQVRVLSPTEAKMVSD